MHTVELTCEWSSALGLSHGTFSNVESFNSPSDFIKTRLQTIPRPGESSYDGIRDCFNKVCEKEGSAAFFKGWGVRVARQSMQFGCMALLYEYMAPKIRNVLSPNSNNDLIDYQNAFRTRAIDNKTDDADRMLRSLGSNSLKPFGSDRRNR